MTISPALPSYTELTAALNSAETPFLGAQIHGYIAGLICGTSGKMDNSWQNVFLEDKNNRSGREALQQLFEVSYHLISEFSFEFTLLLPDDKTDINIRTEALSSWCQGFLTGLKNAKVSLEKREPGEITDALNDIIEIAKVNFGDIKADDEDEMAYFELLEYVRLAVLMIFHEINTPSSEETNEDSWMQ